ncbi:TlpA disulfide reductase family protein [Cellulophaga sp. BC115SP]|uniref:TlpA family protein disulfide reductase n=1 Tax=Cellulophaga sp. BC115SP TaxID=2683263 RepID=UPI001412E255|nr:TlpA disulfide reductase family protein [Cellulophaga sp. BC115SP]NBB29856.1 redoxin domain-containing protein [Cellulophaga sp. BC115SP]
MTYIKCTLIAFTFLITFKISAQSSKLIGKPAPDIHFTNVLNDTKTSYKLSDFKGKGVIIDFWATWCGHCVTSLPRLAEWQKKYPQVLKVITISSDARGQLQKFFTSKKINISVVMDSLGKYKKYFPHFELPHTIIIDKNGFVKYITAGNMLKERDIDLLIQGKKVSLPLKE